MSLDLIYEEKIKKKNYIFPVKMKKKNLITFFIKYFFRSDYTAWIWLWRGRHVDVCVRKNILRSTTNLVKFILLQIQDIFEFYTLITEVLRSKGLEFFFCNLYL